MRGRSDRRKTQQQYDFVLCCAPALIELVSARIGACCVWFRDLKMDCCRRLVVLDHREIRLSIHQVALREYPKYR